MTKMNDDLGVVLDLWLNFYQPNWSKEYHDPYLLLFMNKTNSNRLGGEPTAKKSSKKWFLKNLQIKAEEAWFNDYGRRATMTEEVY